MTKSQFHSPDFIKRGIQLIRLMVNETAHYIRDHGGGLKGIKRLVKILFRTLFSSGPKGLYRVIAESFFPTGIQQEFEDYRRQAQPVNLLASNIPPPTPHSSQVDIIVCIHNALEDARACLFSILEHTSPPYKLIIVDDGSTLPTSSFLLEFAIKNDALLIRNDNAKRYTAAANQGLHAATGEYIALLNSDTIVSAGWLDRLILCAESDETIGLVGPLSNTASWQSIPEYEVNGDWASNPLPKGIGTATMAEIVARYSARLYPRMPFLNGFCLLIRRAVIDKVGYFDELNFPYGYGEENDYCLRARAAGWLLALADDVYVYHAQSKSYSHDSRKELSKSGSNALLRLHNPRLIDEGVNYCRNNIVLSGIRARAKYFLDRESTRLLGEQYANKRILFVLPIDEIGGGANIVLLEAAAMLAMGIDVRIVNLKRNFSRFQRRYAGQEVPVIYLTSLRDLDKIADDFDAIIATANHTVASLLPFVGQNKVLGYYIQDFEPYFYQENSPEYTAALNSYICIDNMKLFTKTEWNKNEIKCKVGKDVAVIGPSLDVDLFMPRPRQHPIWPQSPMRICAMVRPASKHRNPLFTMEILREIAHQFSTEKVEIIIFGVDSEDPKYIKLPRDFPHSSMGILNPQEMAILLNDCDIFADFSVYQAMGLTALEAMSCGTAILVPVAGGANSFAKHEINALIVDTTSQAECTNALIRLITDRGLRERIQRSGIDTAARFFPEHTALNILQVLFGRKRPANIEFEYLRVADSE